MNLYFKETGRDNPETIIFLHELNMAGWMWDKQVESFSDYHCIVPDLPEHGKSIESPPFTIRSAAEEIVELIKTNARNGKAHLVGISLGAQIVLQIINDAPEKVDHALISGALVNRSQPSDSFLELFNYLLETYIPVKNHHLSIGSYVRCYGIPKSRRKDFIKSTHMVKPDSTREILKENILFRMPDKLDKIDTPVLIMAGEKDYIIIKESARELAGVLPNARAFLAPGVGHVWSMEKPDLFNEIIRGWITENPLPGNLIKV